MTTAIESRRKYSPDERREALTVFASQNGQREYVERALAQCGLGHVNIRTLESWAYVRYRDEYEHIKAEVESFTRSRQADKFRALSDYLSEQAGEAGRQVAELLREGRISPKEMPRATRELVAAAEAALKTAEGLSGHAPPPAVMDVTVIAGDLRALGVKVALPAELEGVAPEAPALPAGD